MQPWLQIKLYLYTIRAIGTQIMIKSGKPLTINNIESQCQTLLTSSIKSTYINSFNGNRLGE